MTSPNRREALSRQRILQTALDLVDREGLDALAMRRVGQELGVEAMSLYNHVPSKAAMLDGIFERVLGELAPAKKSASWQAALRDRAGALRKALRAHPNVLPLFATRPAVTPSSIAHVEAVLAVLHAAGFSADAGLSALQVLSAYVVGHTLAAYAPRRSDEDARPAYHRLDPDEFPRVREAAALLPTHDVEREFQLGLEAMLTGLEARLGRRQRSRARRA